jgi:hypothetical protein
MAKDVIVEPPRPEDREYMEPFQWFPLVDQVNYYIAEVFFNINELLQ